MGRANNRAVAAMSGIFVVDKPTGMSSMAAVSVVRARAGGVKTGHAGTLDPLASGVLVMALGKATKHLGRFMAADKRYRAVVDLSAFTSTDDLEGERREVEVTRPPGEAEIRSALGRFVGRIMQRPPAYSAVKIAGQRAYKLSRRGEAVEIRARPVTIHRLDLVRYAWPVVELDVCCGKGTYIRSLARDLGETLGTGGHCRELRRTAIGPFTDRMARPLDEIPEPLTACDLMALETALELLQEHREGADHDCG